MLSLLYFYNNTYNFVEYNYQIILDINHIMLCNVFLSFICLMFYMINLMILKIFDYFIVLYDL